MADPQSISADEAKSLSAFINRDNSSSFSSPTRRGAIEMGEGVTGSGDDYWKRYNLMSNVASHVDTMVSTVMRSITDRAVTLINSSTLSSGQQQAVNTSMTGSIVSGVGASFGGLLSTAGLFTGNPLLIGAGALVGLGSTAFGMLSQYNAAAQAQYGASQALAMQTALMSGQGFGSAATYQNDFSAMTPIPSAANDLNSLYNQLQLSPVGAPSMRTLHGTFSSTITPMTPDGSVPLTQQMSLAYQRLAARNPLNYGRGYDNSFPSVASSLTPTILLGGEAAYQDAIMAGLIGRDDQSGYRAAMGQFETAGYGAAGYGGLMSSGLMGLSGLSVTGAGPQQLRRIVPYLQGLAQTQAGMFASQIQQLNPGNLNDAELINQLMQTNPQLAGQVSNLIAGRNQATLSGMQIPYQVTRQIAGMEDTSVQGELLKGQTFLQQSLFGDSSDAAFGYLGGINRRAAGIYRGRSTDTTNYNPAEREYYAAAAAQQEFLATTGQAEQASGIRLARGLSAGGAAFSAGTASVAHARLYGSGADMRSGLEQELSGLQQSLATVNAELNKNVNNYMKQNELLQRSNEIQGQITQVSNQAAMAPYDAALSIAGSKQGIMGQQLARFFMSGGGGVAGTTALGGDLAAASATAAAAQQRLAMRASQIRAAGGNPETNPEYQQMALEASQAQTGVTQAAVNLGSAPLDYHLRSALSSTQYTADVLQSVPGSYGNLRGALTSQFYLLNQAGAQKRAQYEAAARAVGGEQNLPDSVKLQFQEGLQDIGRQQAGTFEQLSYGWESRLMSQVLGAPGNFGYVANRFSLRDAVGWGVNNPHFGANVHQLPFFLQQAAMLPSMSLAGSTGTPGGFAMTALTGRDPAMYMRGQGAYAPGLDAVDDAGTIAHNGGRSSDDKTITLDITIRWPDGSIAWQGSKQMGGGLGNMEDVANRFTHMAQGQ